MNIQRFLIWLLVSVQGLVLLFDIHERAKYNATVLYFLQFQHQFIQTVANDLRYLIAFFLLLPLIAGDFLFVKLFAVVAYCMDLVIVENMYLRVEGQWSNLRAREWLECGTKLVLLFLAFEALIMSILDDQPSRSQHNPNLIRQSKAVIPPNQKAQIEKA